MSKFFKGFGIGAAVVAIAGLAGAGYLAAKKIKESDKRFDDIVKDLLKRKDRKECLCEEGCECTCEAAPVELEEVEPIVVEDEAVQLEIEDFVPLMEKDLNEVTQDDYLEAVIEQRDTLQAEVDELKATKKRRRK